ncbi:beta-glucosidase [Sinorhizobium fredii NGR234]|uniref:Beta-D-glucoside glucohydrolase n=1 Tax=Sinorhizobium fredii (strain NBRC 101917 / NGR234) TaxID=394 RepID=C3MIB6_SINFN|nr:glycoside hydrolase family 3 C-terminal domain-containing protein [Sinorhizobium fredii]ACP24464.1 beta-glucosidase [Sinorhizobium fredii NGR234]
MIDVKTLLDEMTLAEQVSLLSGDSFWSLPCIQRLGIGTLRLTDGPNGARGAGSLIGGVSAAAFPVGIALGATWNPGLMRAVGEALAEEVQSKGAHVSLAPTINIQRSVTNGRNFECYSEDPVLTAELAVGFIEGMQAKKVSATVKHFVGNESEIERTTISSDIDERTLREVYLVPFEAAVKRAKTWAVMSSYNKLNGTYTAENHWLLTEVLRGDWGFDGVVMSDWFGSRSTAPTVNAGLDLEMPGPSRDRGDKLLAAIESGEVSVETIRDCVQNILTLMVRTGAIDDHRELKERADDRPEHRALIRRAGAESAVLLQNDGILPLPQQGTVAVIGPNAKAAQIMGGGSAQLNPHYTVSPWQGLAGAIGEANLHYAQGCTNHRFEPLIEHPTTFEFFQGRELLGDPVKVVEEPSSLGVWLPPVADGLVDPHHFSARMRTRFTAAEDGIHRIGLTSAGLGRVYVDGELVVDAWTCWTRGTTFFEEGCEEVVGEITLEAGRTYEIVAEYVRHDHVNLYIAAIRVGIGKVSAEAEISEAAAVAAKADRAVVFVGRTSDWDTEGSDLRDIALPGLQDRLVDAVIAANPNTVVVLQTGGPVEMPWLSKARAVLQCWYPGQEAGNAIADVLLGKAEPSGRLAQSFPARWLDNPTQSDDPEVYPGKNGHVRYDEGVFVGYRHYDRAGTKPLFPFGHGLGYTSFAIADLTVGTPDGAGSVTVALKLTNTGERAGATVVQIYVSDTEASLPRPVKELKAFAKVALERGESRRVTFTLDARAFAFFDAAERCWRIEGGEFTVMAGLSAGDIRLAATVTQASATMPR